MLQRQVLPPSCGRQHPCGVAGPSDHPRLVGGLRQLQRLAGQALSPIEVAQGLDRLAEIDQDVRAEGAVLRGSRRQRHLEVDDGEVVLPPALTQPADPLLHRGQLADVTRGSSLVQALERTRVVTGQDLGVGHLPEQCRPVRMPQGQRGAEVLQRFGVGEESLGVRARALERCAASSSRPANRR